MRPFLPDRAAAPRLCGANDAGWRAGQAQACSASSRRIAARPVAVVRIAQRDAELAFDQRVRDALVVVIEAARHRRQLGCLERHQRRRRQAEQAGGMGDDRLGRRRLVVADIVDRAGPRPRDRGGAARWRSHRHGCARTPAPACRCASRCRRAARRTGCGRGRKSPARRKTCTGTPRRAPQIEPAGFGRDPAPAALAARAQLARSRRPSRRRGRRRRRSSTDSRARQARERGDVVAMAVEHRVAGLVRRHRDAGHA